MPSKRTGRLISSIKTDKKGRHVIVFSSTEKMVLDDDAYTEVPLYVGKELSEDDYLHLKGLINESALYSYGLSLAVKGCYSEKDVMDKLFTKRPHDRSVYDIIKRLKGAGLLDDKEFADNYLESMDAQNYGKKRIEDDLLNKHRVDPDIVSKLKFDHEPTKAKKAAEMIERRYPSLTLKMKKRKGIDALSRRGFSYEVASLAVSSYKEDREKSQKELEKVASILIKRYSRKYNGYELKNKCFLYLASKGYKSEDIERILEEYL
ncbi:MAG: RecX family transcriptional regulator [Bacilli bacterium]|nr:RecX family transcriptional regulator [Bacilli bacterium]